MARQIKTAGAWAGRAAWLLMGLLSACGADGVVVGPCDHVACNDHNPCTTDGCAKDGSCTHEATDGACDDSNACTVNDACQSSVCAGSVRTCDDKIACTADSCSVKIGCIHLPGDATLCSDGNVCTDDGCDLSLGCTHTANSAPCTDGNACTLMDTCATSACSQGSTTVACDDANPCTTDACDTTSGACSHVANSAKCDDGNACTLDDVCAATTCQGTLDCACAIAAGQVLPPENCDTPGDDNCNNLVNEVAVCGATLYKFSASAECGASCYYDEAHNIAISGSADKAAGFASFAAGQLLDGVRGVDDWATNLGKGVGFEWVAWTAPLQIVTVVFAKPRDLALVRLGLNNKKDGAVAQPPELQLRFSMDATKWSVLHVFKTADGTQPAIPPGHRGDIDLSFAVQTARFVEIRFVTPGSWTFLDELEFD